MVETSILNRVASAGVKLRARIPASILRFLFVGGTAVLIDGSSYSLLLSMAVPAGEAKTASFIAGAVFAYFANRHWTFNDAKDPRGSFVPFAILYIISLLVNVLVNHALLWALGHGKIGYAISWFCATGCSAVLNYVGMRRVVFR